jgi:DNA-binding NtrC family response regulator
MTSAIPIPNVPKKVEVLAVSGDETELDNLRCLFAGSSWGFRTAHTLTEAREWLSRNETPVVLCDSSFPHGDWKELLRLTMEMAHSPCLVVVSRLADNRLWSEVLNLGGYDVLALPVKRAEVFRTVSGAWRSWKDRFDRKPIALPLHACSG